MTKKRKTNTHTHRDVGIICVKIYDDLALEAWTQRIKRERGADLISIHKEKICKGKIYRIWPLKQSTYRSILWAVRNVL